MSSDALASPARIAAADALRRLGQSVVGREVDDDVFRRLTATVDDLVADVEAGPPRSRPVDDLKRRLFDDPPPDGHSMDHFPDCIVSGPANPMGIAIQVHREGGEAVARVALGPAFEGAPGRAHGGVVAAIFDDTLGFVLGMERTPAYTARLTVSYLAPTPIGEELEFRARLRNRRGRKLLIDGTAYHGSTRFAESEGLFIAIPPERFGMAPS